MKKKRMVRMRWRIGLIGVELILLTGCGKVLSVREASLQAVCHGGEAGLLLPDGRNTQRAEKFESSFQTTYWCISQAFACDMQGHKNESEDTAVGSRQEEGKSADTAEEKEIDGREEYRGRYQRLFCKEDFVPEEILCDNVFDTYQDGRENPEILSLYEEVGETWEYLFYTAYDFNDDKRMDYAVVRSNSDDSGVKEGFCGADIWFLSANGGYEREELPKAVYRTGGTWQEPELFMMTLVYRFGEENQSIAVYHDQGKKKMALYGWWYSSRYERVRAQKITEEISDTTLIQTELQINDWSWEYWDEWIIKVEFLGKTGEPDFYQVLLVDRDDALIRWRNRQESMAWDGDDDGQEDILYYIGSGGGSGGSFGAYELFRWSEEEGKYVDIPLPLCISIDYEAHKIYYKWRYGAGYEWYDIYGLRNGEYQLEQRIILEELMSEDGEWILGASYFEWGELVEEIVNVDVDWEELERILQEKHPEFDFWTVG